jgi:hypothetical protein
MEPVLAQALATLAGAIATAILDGRVVLLGSESTRETA